MVGRDIKTFLGEEVRDKFGVIACGAVDEARLWEHGDEFFERGEFVCHVGCVKTVKGEVFTFHASAMDDEWVVRSGCELCADVVFSASVSGGGEAEDLDLGMFLAEHGDELCDLAVGRSKVVSPA